jgi:drug/metabolite transporter (DMT)-like permease
MLTVPTAVLLNVAIYKRRYSLSCLGALSGMTAGVVLTILTRNQDYNLAGLAMGLVAVLTVSLSQVFASELQKEHSIDPVVMTYAGAPIRFCLLLGLSFAFEPLAEASMFSWKDHPSILGYLLISIACSVILQLTQLWVLGVFSSVTYAVAGQMKTVAIVFLGILFFNDQVNQWIILGTAMVVVCGLWFNRSK